ncbi:hypothetical protein [Spirosoma pomorum]
MFIAFKHVPNDPDLANSLITFWTESAWTHCEILLNYPRPLAVSSRPATGVTAKTWEEVLTSPDIWDLYDVPVSSPESLWAFLLGEMGKPYNWTGLVMGHVVGATQLNPNGWFCSELTYATLSQYALIDLPLREPAHVSPALLRQYLIDAGCTRYGLDNHQLTTV